MCTLFYMLHNQYHLPLTFMCFIAIMVMQSRVIAKDFCQDLIQRASECKDTCQDPNGERVQDINTTTIKITTK